MYAMFQLNQISSMIENNDLIEKMEEKADEMNERKRNRRDSGIDDEFNDIIVDRPQGGAALRGGSRTQQNRMNQTNGDPSYHVNTSSDGTYDDYNQYSDENYDDFDANRNVNTNNNNNNNNDLRSGHQRNHVGSRDSMDTAVITRLNTQLNASTKPRTSTTGDIEMPQIS